MQFDVLDDAARLLEKANANLEPDLLTAEGARRALASYARIERLASFGETVLSRRINDASEVARMTGTSVGGAKETVETGKRLHAPEEVSGALRCGDVSPSSRRPRSPRRKRPGPDWRGSSSGSPKQSPSTSLGTGPERSPLEAEQQRDLGACQRAARGARAQRDELGMVNLYLRLEPHVGTPIVNRAEAEAARLYRRA